MQDKTIIRLAEALVDYLVAQEIDPADIELLSSHMLKRLVALDEQKLQSSHSIPTKIHPSLTHRN